MPVKYYSDRKIFVLKSNEIMYAFEIEESGYPINIYYGKAISDYRDFPVDEMNFERRGSLITHLNMYRREYPVTSDFMYDEGAFSIRYADGARECILTYADYEIKDENHLDLILKDSREKIKVTLHYETFDDVNIINRSVTVENIGDDTVTLTKVMSSALYLPDFEKYNLTTLPGKWGGEYQKTRQELKRGKYVAEARTGYPNHQIAPYFALDKDAKENSGKVWFGTLNWCGNHKMVVDRNEWGNVYVTAGINDYDFSYPLNSGEIFSAPVFTFGYTEDGFGGAARTLHNYQRLYVSPQKHTDTALPVLYNAYAAFELDIDAEKLMALSEKAAKIGAELFVVDDGWYGESPDNICDFGDWTPHTTKFPDGLKPLIEKVNSLGMKFGLWIEPEMTSKTSKLYKEHPDWLLGCEYCEQKPLIGNRLVLNLAKEEVFEHIKNVLYKLLSENNIEYLKWDSNRSISQQDWIEQQPENKQKVWYEYFKNVYWLFEFINTNFPDVIIENCASGGGRAEIGLAKYSSRINRSDNQDPRDVMFLHDGFTYMHRPKFAGGGGHISKSPSGINQRYTPLRYRAHMAMLGSLAVGMDLRNMTDDELDEVKYYIEQYKSIRHITQCGELYKLVTPENGEYCVYQYVTRDKSESVVLIFGLNISFAKNFPRLLLEGLDETKRYKIQVLPDAKGERNAECKYMSGDGLKNVGLHFNLMGDYDSILIKLEEIE